MSRRHQHNQMKQRQQRVVITGFMGAGKTTVARALSRLLGCAPLDLDDLITTRERRTPRQLIDEDGEDAFRDAETRALREALVSGQARIISTGGGAWTFERNRALVSKYGCVVVWLDAPFELCWQRSRTDDDSRPFARRRERAQSLYDERLASYRLASLRVEVTPDKSVEEVAAEIVSALARVS